jgi:Xaa-Pro aminopeptidase
VPDNHAVRRDRLRALVASLPADAACMVVTRLVNVRYLTGFTGSNAALLVTADGAVLATDGRYITQAEQQAPDLERVIDRQCATALVERARKDGVDRLAFEAHDVTVDLHETLRSTGEGVELVPSGQLVEQLRSVKDDDEIALLRQACAIGDQALTELFATIAPGRTEREIGRDLENRMLDHGATGVAFETIVATGPNSAVPHHRPTARVVAAGDLLKIDFGALYEGYHADCTRTVVVGAEPAGWQREIHDLVCAAQRAGRYALAPGVDVRQVDAAAREVVTAAGYGEAFSHGLGHGVGLEIHEAPLINADSDARLADRTPVTVEPGVYLPGRGGVRIEDTLVVRDGEPELLTTTPKDLLVL